MISDPTIEANSGDILFGANNENNNGVPTHYIIYLNAVPDNTDLFYGAMITHSKGFGNIALLESHFETHDEHGHPFLVVYDRSLISSDLYHKKKNWAPFTKVGRLTTEGLAFVKATVGQKNAIDFPHNK